MYADMDVNKPKQYELFNYLTSATTQKTKDPAFNKFLGRNLHLISKHKTWGSLSTPECMYSCFVDTAILASSFPLLIIYQIRLSLSEEIIKGINYDDAWSGLSEAGIQWASSSKL